MFANMHYLIFSLLLAHFYFPVHTYCESGNSEKLAELAVMLQVKKKLKCKKHVRLKCTRLPHK